MTSKHTATPAPKGEFRGVEGDKTVARRAAASALLGGALEYYDFYVYALAAALVFPSIMFPADGGSATSVLLSLATLGVGYVARPLGAVVFGHLGDRFGRKKTLMATILLMGIATTIIGFLPTFHDVGILAPILLVILRLAQGFSAGAETTGASTLTMESAPTGHRGFYTQWTQGGNWTGFVLANLIFLPLAAMPQEDLFSWGWRVPFFLSLLVVAVAIFLRLRLKEPAIFVADVKEGEAKVKEQIPLFAAIREYPWSIAKMVMLTTAASFNTLVFAFGLSFATRPEFGIEIPSVVMIWTFIIANALGVGAQALWGLVADRFGRRPVIIWGSLGSVVGSVAVFAAMVAENVPLMCVLIVVSNCLAYAAYSSSFQVFGGEMFPAKVRFTATSVGFAVGVVIVGFVPTIAAATITTDNWLVGPLIVLVTAGAASIAALTSRETAHVPLEDLGLRESARERTR